MRKFQPKATAAHMRRYLTVYKALHATDVDDPLPNHYQHDLTPHAPDLTHSSSIGKAKTGELFNAEGEIR
jgi:hypothetical protein